MRVIISAAGTGGHINPGIAIANKIKEEEPNSKIIFVGTNRGLENDLVPRAGYELKHINAYGFERKISVDNFKKVCKTIHSIKEAKKIIEKFKPDVVIGTGGYICLPVAIAAKKKLSNLRNLITKIYFLYDCVPLFKSNLTDREIEQIRNIKN